MSDTMKIWDSFGKTDPNFTKSYKGKGGFAGTSTNATYLAKKATLQFGPCGIGWGCIPLKEEVIECGGNDRLHKVTVEFWYMLNGQRGSIIHYGQTMLTTTNKNGLSTDEEAPKKSFTDGMTKCMSMLGLASDIHMGMFDDNKYVNQMQDYFDNTDEFQRDPVKIAAAKGAPAPQAKKPEKPAELGPDEASDKGKVAATPEKMAQAKAAAKALAAAERDALPPNDDGAPSGIEADEEAERLEAAAKQEAEKAIAPVVMDYDVIYPNMEIEELLQDMQSRVADIPDGAKPGAVTAVMLTAAVQKAMSRLDPEVKKAFRAEAMAKMKDLTAKLDKAA